MLGFPLEMPIEHASVRVTARATTNTVPIMTNCWTSLGTTQADMSLNEKIVVIAQVTQGSNPVIGAEVVALIQKDGVSKPIEISLKDSGSGADNVANDGLYSRYFTVFDTKTSANTRYSLKCVVKGTPESKINKGFEHIQDYRAGHPLCCGSNTVHPRSVLEPTGNFTRYASGGSIEMINANQVRYGPGEITDFRGLKDRNQYFYELSFSATGNVLDSGTISRFVVYATDKLEDLQDVNTIHNSVPSLTAADVVNPGSFKPLEAGSAVTLQVLKSKLKPSQQYFFRIYSVGANANLFSWSNIARVIVERK